MCNFYEKLYDTQNISNSDIENYLQITNSKRLTYNIKDKCDQFPILDECKETVMDIKHNKSPGLDGLPAELSQCFWDQLSELFYEMLTVIFRMNEMTFSQRHDDYISKEQTAYIKGRYIGTNARLILDILNTVKITIKKDCFYSLILKKHLTQLIGIFCLKLKKKISTKIQYLD